MRNQRSHLWPALFGIAILTLSSCAYHVYSPSEHSSQIRRSEMRATRLAQQATALNSANASLRKQEMGLRKRLDQIRSEIERLRSVPEAVADAESQSSLETLFSEQRAIQAKLVEVRAELRQQQEEQQRIRNERVH